MGVKIELISFAFVSMGMLVCFRSSASSYLTTLAFCVLFLSLSKRPSCVKMLPRHLHELSTIDADGKVAWRSDHLHCFTLTKADFLVVCFNAAFRLLVCSCLDGLFIFPL